MISSQETTLATTTTIMTGSDEWRTKEEPTVDSNWKIRSRGANETFLLRLCKYTIQRQWTAIRREADF